MKLKAVFFLGALMSTSFLTAGCEVGLKNLTPEKVIQNDSGIYALEIEAKSKNANIDPLSVKPKVVINGEIYPMSKNKTDSNTYVYDYEMPIGANRARYYYLVDYKIKYRDIYHDKQIQSPLYDLELKNRYVTELQNERGLIGSTVPVMGNGFSSLDKIYIGGKKAKTQFISKNQLNFIVPELTVNQIYDIVLNNGFDTKRIGEFRVDPARIRVNKSRIDLKEYERTQLVFKIDHLASSKGQELEITTEIPESIIMAPVKVPANKDFVEVTLEGGKAGVGHLFINAPGYEETSVPVKIVATHTNL